MEVQKVLFPGEECGEPEMYFRGIPPSAIDAAGGTVLVRRGETVSLDTYFNSFSAGKWRRYTGLGNLSFRFHLERADGGANQDGMANRCGGANQGPGCRIRIVHAVAEADAEGIARLRRDENFRSDIEETSRRIAGLVRVREEELPFALETSRDGGRTSCECRIGGIPEDGILYAEIAPEAGALVGGMSWRTDADGIRLNRVRLAVGICTFRREEAVTRTVRKLEAAVARGGDSGPWDELGIYVADNGRTFGPDAFPSGRVRLLPNPNLGGSAGFARTMIEAVLHGREEDFTHIVLMDDDVVLSPDTVERTYTFLRFVREEYGESMLGGAMFHEDRRHYQHESGALFDGTRHFKVAGRFHDMRRREFVALNANRAVVNYLGWWYCCVPAAAVRRLGLPLPLFLHFDDIEYGLRNSGREHILLNGICVWHPQLQNKDPAWATYYNVRNYLVVSALYGLPGMPGACLAVARLFLWLVLSYRYVDAWLLRRAVDDFAGGAGHFLRQDAAALHADILTYGYRRRTPGDLGIDMGRTAAHACPGSPKANVLRQLLSALLPPGRRTRVYDAAACSYLFDAGRCYVYDAKAGDGVLYERSPRAFLSESASFLKSLIRLALSFGRAGRQFREIRNVLSGVPFWEEYLGLECRDGARGS